MKAITTTIFILLATLSASIIHVPQDQPSIQAGIDAALGGDTVLVDTGTYVEEIDFDGKNIVVGSLFLTTGDTSYISQTIIDGDSTFRSVSFHNGEDSTAILKGFTIKNCIRSAIYIGYSSPTLSHLKIVGNSNPYSFGGGISIWYSNPKISNVIIEGNHAELGGGIYCKESSPTLTNVIIRGNSASSRGGGIFCTWNSNPILANVSIHNNSARYGGGIYITQNSYPNFDDENRCNIYLNYAGAGSDIFTYSSISIAIDTFTVLIPTDYHALPLDGITFDIQNEKIDQVEIDLFVSPGGSDNNSGIDEEHPLKTINKALSKIYADSLNRRTIYLSSGTYSPSINEELFPLNCASFVSITGEGVGKTVLDAQGQTSVIYCYHNKNLVISNMTIQNGGANSGGGVYCRGSNPVFRHMEIRENSADSYGGGVYLYYSTPIFFDVTIAGNTAGAAGGGIYCYNSSPNLMKVLISGNVSSGGGGIYCGNDSNPILANVTISDNTANIHGGGISCYNDSHPVLINSTFWNNSPEEVHIRQSGFEVGRSSITVSHSDIQRNVDGIIINDGIVNWLEGNIDADPLFVDAENGDFHLQEGSPCIDSGTDLFVWDGDTLINLPDTAYQGNAPDMGTFESPYTVSIVEEQILPVVFALHQNYPNPFNPVTTIRYELPIQTEVKLTIYNIIGQEVAELVNGKLVAGEYEIIWNASNVTSGIYFYRLETPGKQITKKLVVLK